ncbi:hypothetical protein [Erythrobacter alti]|uniref:hypothetical protein n=1 Tax=Erythrobacter alti TaxID=1896145 RepID=UPI0030F3F044
MKRSQIRKFFLAGSVCGLLAACGGGSGGGIASTPPPSPTPPMGSAAAPPIPAGPIGLQSSAPFITASVSTDGWGSIWSEEDVVRITYSATDGTYRVDGGTYVPLTADGTYNSNGWTNIERTRGYISVDGSSQFNSKSFSLDWPQSSRFTYTSFGSEYQSASFGEHKRVLAYGIPTSANDVPITGTASYSGDIRGLTNGRLSPTGGVGPSLDVFGSVDLAFNFAAGTLSGEMRPRIAIGVNGTPLGTYAFRDTVYSTGSTSFSGSFAAPGSNAESFFRGRFTGPQGTELMANWQAPFVYPNTTEIGTMAGVWIARRN